ncbi:MAG: SPOR domain-containing protein [Holosporales bacterium]
MRLLRRREQRVENRRRIVRYSLIAGSVVGLIGGVYGFASLFSAKQTTEVPIVKAEAGPVKIRMEGDEGKAVPHQEKTIYNQLAAQDAPSTGETLLPEPEQPVAHTPALGEDFLSHLDESESSSVVKNELTAAPLEDVRPEQDQQASPEGDQKIDLAHSPSKPAISVAVAAEEEAPLNVMGEHVEKKKQTTAKAAPKAKYGVQLAAMRTQEAADQEWQRLKKMPRVGALLRTLKPNFERIDLGAARGVRYRLWVAAENEEAARKFCQALRSLGIDCLLKRP